MVQVVGVIADIVGSRELTDRPAAQRALADTFAPVEACLPAQRPAWATVGDEFQLIATTWQEALRTTLRVRTRLAEKMRLRFGRGAGQIHTSAEGETRPIHKGTAWRH